jgi:hypothetical protein
MPNGNRKLNGAFCPQKHEKYGKPEYKVIVELHLSCC